MDGSNRRAQHRKSARRIFVWSFALAVALHVIVVLTVPGLRISVVEAFRDQERDPDLSSAVLLDLFFGPPAIRNASGELSLEPLERVAGDLWYRFLPNDSFPAPVEVIQPMVFREKAGL